VAIVAASAALFAGSGAVVGAGAPQVPRFVVSALALAALAALVGESLEQVGRHLRPNATGLLQASLGNLPELMVSVFALRAGLTGLVQAALIGSVLSNLLLVLGAAFLSGALRHGAQSFEPEAPRMTVALLTLAVGSLAVPTLAGRLDTPAAHHVAGLSEATAAVLLLVYLVSIPFWLAGGLGRSPAPVPPGTPGSAPAPSMRAPGGWAQAVGLRPVARTAWPLWLAIGALAGATGASAAVSSWFVAAVEPATRSLGISEGFTGLVIVAIASNAVENAAGIRFAWRARPDYAISTILNSPLQIALLLTPLLVLLSPALGPAHLLLVFPPLLVAALAISTVAVGIVIYDGEYSWLEGVSLIALYAIVASAFWWG
jgi:Ca2+:H+ antiporter